MQTVNIYIVLGGERLDWKAEVKRLRHNGASWTEIASAMQPMFPEFTECQLREKARSVIRVRKATKPETILDESGNRPVGVFSDPHIPFNHPNYLQFCIDTFKKFNVGPIVCSGDLVDNHALSRFQSEPCAKGAYDELNMSIDEVAKYVKAFPDVKLCLGNHDAIPARQAASVGIGQRYLKSFSEVLKLPETWEVSDEVIINNVLYKHGENCLGKDGALNAAIQERMSVVIGHSHSFGGCKYSANKRDTIFGLNVGCGIDVDAYAFVYGKHAKFRPTLGCGIVFNESYAIFVPMGKEYL